MDDAALKLMLVRKTGHARRGIKTVANDDEIICFVEILVSFCVMTSECPALLSRPTFQLVNPTIELDFLDNTKVARIRIQI